MNAKTYQPSELVVDELYKFVKIGDEYRFCKLVIDHCDIVMAEERSKVTAAGAFVVRDNGIVKGRDYSSTLKIGCNETHWEELSKLLNKSIIGSLL